MKKLFPWADYNRRKSAFKLHLGLDHDGLMPSFARVTEGRKSENEIAKEFTAQKGSVVVFDKGFNSYEWYNSLTKEGIYWATRLRGKAQYEVLEDREFVINGKVLSDQVIKLIIFLFMTCSIAILSICHDVYTRCKYDRS